MCGIVGVYSRQGLMENDHAIISRALDILRYRGPDASGVWSDNRVLIGHTRLAIIDPACGQQPWLEAGSRVVLSYNGELYNYLELRRMLESKGYAFRTNCDTEVLFYAYAEWGESCLEKLRGIFAFAVMDPANDCLWLVRDHLGVKPLYYQRTPARLSFASSLAAILTMQAEAPRWWQPAVAHYLMTSRTEIGNATLFQGVHNLEPGTFLRLALSSGEVITKRYWNLPKVTAADKPEAPIATAKARVVDLLDQSCREQLLSSDVPVGAFLSGGLDSAILCDSLRQEGAALTAYSIGYARDHYNEWPAMARTAERCGLNWVQVQATEEGFWEDCKALIAHKGGPLATPNEVPIYRMAEAFGKDCKVTLTGEGADEIFGGYSGPTFSAFDYDRSLGADGGVCSKALMRAYGKSQFQSRSEHFLLANSWLQPTELNRLFPGLDKDQNGLSAVESWYQDFFSGVKELTTFDAYLHLHARVNLEALLNRLDSSTMRASIEGRVPFTDHRIAEYLFTLPDHYKMRLSSVINSQQRASMNVFELDQAGAIETKRLLREAYVGRVDAEILARRKVSFPVPFMELLEGNLNPNLQAALSEAPALTSLLGATKGLMQSLEDAGTKKPLLAWLLLNLALTEKQWQVGRD
jgi:asparagine synthase (glutamine-hydrolysing)